MITYACMANATATDLLDPLVVGARVKALREAEGLSLRDLAERSGVSAPMLSQVERGETSPTLTVAARIAAGLELRLSQLLRLDEGGAVTVVRAAERRRGGNGAAGTRFEVLTAAAARPARRALAPHARARRRAPAAPDDPPMHEPGSRETALVEQGAVVLVVRRRSARARRGRRASRSTPTCPTTSRTPAAPRPRSWRSSPPAYDGARSTADAEDPVRQDLGGPRGRATACSTSTCTSSTR